MNTNRKSILELPFDIRNMIYEYLTFYEKSVVDLRRSDEQKHRFPQILALNRQFNSECLGYFLNLKLCFTSINHFKNKTAPDCPEGFPSYVREVEIELHTRIELKGSIFDPPERFKISPEHYDCAFNSRKIKYIPSRVQSLSGAILLGQYGAHVPSR
ncbi:hypothetical protein M501DRAFT_866699 [Patellaria atrata CBS 101060]|uniref:Uncharacterized protein n=1 Tax=Patellaria atrata CBS 101060 TaxID=1346257 RepID=A0A9P4S8X3_9PEZI|nr:hypothetical protein M501DRAFT_866699 [Patellaria atrata CBS 101060]